MCMSCKHNAAPPYRPLGPSSFVGGYPSAEGRPGYSNLAPPSTYATTQQTPKMVGPPYHPLYGDNGFPPEYGYPDRRMPGMGSHYPLDRYRQQRYDMRPPIMFPRRRNDYSVDSLDDYASDFDDIVDRRRPFPKRMSTSPSMMDDMPGNEDAKLSDALGMLEYYENERRNTAHLLERERKRDNHIRRPKDNTRVDRRYIQSQQRIPFVGRDSVDAETPLYHINSNPVPPLLKQKYSFVNSTNNHPRDRYYRNNRDDRTVERNGFRKINQTTPEEEDDDDDAVSIAQRNTLSEQRKNKLEQKLKAYDDFTLESKRYIQQILDERERKRQNLQDILEKNDTFIHDRYMLHQQQQNRRNRNYLKRLTAQSVLDQSMYGYGRPRVPGDGNMNPYGLNPKQYINDMIYDMTQ